MKINKENIEQQMFDFFEGNLSEAEKEQVLNFVHQNPEYEQDFVHWAQGYSHVGSEASDYGIREQLIKKEETPVFQNKKKAYWLILLLPILFLFYFVQKKEPELHKVDKIEFKNTDEPQTIITDKEVKSVSPSKIDAVQKQEIVKTIDVYKQDNNIADPPSLVVLEEVETKAVVEKVSVSKIVPLVQNKSLKKDSLVTPKAIEDNKKESRREWLLWMMQKAGEKNKRNGNFQFWQQHNHPNQLDTI